MLEVYSLTFRAALEAKEVTSLHEGLPQTQMSPARFPPLL
jgi:hypothetical protein